MAQASEGTTEVVEAVRFGFMTNEEVRKHSVVRITNPVLVDAMGTPCPHGLYDPALGPLNENSTCVTCGQRSFLCNGHCGHILLVSPTFNPLLFNSLLTILNKTCLYCFHFQCSKQEVESCISQLELIVKGDIVGAKRSSSGKVTKESDFNVNDIVNIKDSQGSSHSRVLGEIHENQEPTKGGCWDSIHLTEAKSVLEEFLKKKESKRKCKKCSCTSPAIRKPTFGWLDLAKLRPPIIRANAIQCSKLDAPFSGLEEVNASDSSRNDDSEIIEADSSDIPENRSRRHFTHDLESLMASSGPLVPSQVMTIMSRLWKNETPLCSYICNILPGQYDKSGNITGYSMFFLETILVTPIKFRPPARSGDSIMEHPLTVQLGKVLESNIALGEAHNSNGEQSKIIRRWMDLQQSINGYFDSKTSTSRAQRDGTGIIQLLEKKEGAFRQKMMGKRVNFACRSVISPDPYLGVHEIGVPPYFALRLTYPERVTPWNVEKLRDAVINGPDVLPGAITYADSSGTSKIPRDAEQGGRGKFWRMKISRKLPSSRGAVTASGKTNELDFEGKVVYRHLQDGDIVLVNRQPTLHKPSIMAHVVRVLKGEKTLRMHYANCSSYNADFDGDEMNVHFPQDEISRAEAYNIVNANEQYIVPTRGDTVRGLIQDHIVSAVLLTMKNTFLTHSEFNQLLYGSGVFATGPSLLSGKHCQKVSLLNSESLVVRVLPAVWKPEPLWTGKQVITALLNHITKGLAPCTVENQGKIPKTYFTNDTYKNGEEEEDHNAEHKLLIWKNELVRGVIDKAQFGKFGLVHTVQELYGSNSAGVLLSALSRLFTLFLQIHGFTCGVDDLMILPDYDAQRKEKLEGEDIGEEVHCEFVKFKPGQIGPEELQMEIEKAISSDRESATAMLDMKMKNKLTNKLTREGSQILKHLLTSGLLKPFPRNCISTMTTSGAKGSTVNFQQISAYLGQQELEGKRVPRMVSGKSLPSFPPWDYTSRAGGFITDRFLTGLRPQEYYFHCMAGREGLVDTAVKTSRSGYLQRCLVKNLESLRVWYDCTVRDADGSIVQFHYGEDGVDPHKTSFLKNFKSLKDNQETFCQKFHYKREFNTYIDKLPEGLEEEALRFIRGPRNKSSEVQKSGGSEHPHKKQKSRKKERLSEKQEDNGNGEDLMEVVKQKYLYSLAESGEPVGVIAAQSVGEPSTQMTLNTFHLAGRGEMNVTLGIPRLQEILMTASDVIKTPILTCPFLQWRSKRDVVSLVSRAKKVAVADLVESMEVELSIRQDKKVSKIYKLTIKLKDTEFVSLDNTRNTLESVYLRELEEAIENHVKFLERVSGIKDYSASISGASGDIDEDMPDIGTQERNDDDDDGDDMGDDLGADVAKRKQQATDEVDYDEPDVDPNEESSSARTARGTGNGRNGESEDCISESEHDSDENSNSDDDDEVPSEAKFEWFSNKPPRHIYKKLKGLSFEVHFKFTDEPHLLLAQIAQRTAKKVYIKNAGKISNCRMVQYDPDEKTVIWEDKKRPKKGDTEKAVEDGAYWAVKASGVDFQSLWELQEDLDMSRLYSNNVHAMLTTYGVEAARATIIREVTQVFDIYGVKVDFHHLSLIADFMTHTGGYRAMSRHGGISDSLSPFLKMSFETASKYMVEAASYGLTDNLETPSSRICLGLPVKMGTGSFELMQKLEI